MLDFHSNRYGNSLASGNESLYDQASWIQSWVALVKSVLTNTPAANGKLLIDLINEPDGCAPSSWAIFKSSEFSALYHEGKKLKA